MPSRATVLITLSRRRTPRLRRVDATKPPFRFVLKFPQAISHEHRLVNAEAETEAFLDVLRSRSAPHPGLRRHTETRSANAAGRRPSRPSDWPRKSAATAERPAQPLAVVQDAEHFEKSLGLGFGVDQPMLVTDRLRELEHEPERGLRRIHPAPRCPSTESVESAVGLDGIEHLRVLAQPLVVLGVPGKEIALPFRRGPDRAAKKVQRSFHRLA